MRRVLAYCSWYEQWWLDRADQQGAEGQNNVLLEGLSAYAFRQAKIRSQLREHFKKLWNQKTS